MRGGGWCYGNGDDDDIDVCVHVWALVLLLLSMFVTTSVSNNDKNTNHAIFVTISVQNNNKNQTTQSHRSRHYTCPPSHLSDDVHAVVPGDDGRVGVWFPNGEFIAVRQHLLVPCL